MQAYILKSRLVAAISATSQREAFQRILGLSDIDRFDIILFDETSRATETSLMLTLTTEWFLDVGLVVLGGEHLQLSPDIKSEGESPFGNNPEIPPLEHSFKVYHDRLVVNLIRSHRCHYRICKHASEMKFKIGSDPPDRREECGSSGFYIYHCTLGCLLHTDARRRH